MFSLELAVLVVVAGFENFSKQTFYHARYLEMILIRTRSSSIEVRSLRKDSNN